MLRMTFACLVFMGACSFGLAPAAAAEAVSLTEDYTNPREFSVSVDLKVTGKMQASAGDKKTAINMDLKVDADLEYDERRLPPAGRDARALRSVRFYRNAHADIKVDNQTTLPRLRNQNRLIVAEGQTRGVRCHSPQRPL